MAEQEENAIVVAPRGILLVEDDDHARVALTKLLERRGYEVTAIDSGSEAVVEARRNQVGVVLMDNALDDEIDGVEAAEKIQLEQPLTSFIFVTASAEDPSYRRRVESSPIRLGGWVSKPFEINELVGLIDREECKLKIVADLTSAKKHGVDPAAYLQVRADLDTTLPRGIVAELMEEFQAEALSLNSSAGDRHQRPMAAISTEIDELYDQIRGMVETHPDAPSRQEAVRPLRAKLEELEELEANLLEDHFRAQLRFDPERAEEAEERMLKLLDRA